MTTNDTRAPADAPLAQGFTDSGCNQDHLAPDRASMRQLQSLGQIVEVMPGRFAETAAQRAAGL